LPVRSDVNDPRQSAAVSPPLPRLEQEVDTVPWQLFEREGPPHFGQVGDELVQVLASVAHFKPRCFPCVKLVHRYCAKSR
jgi:hypothetical protein